METLLLLFLLSTLDKNTDVKETLRSFLSFYRENRELLGVLTGMKSSTERPLNETKDRPPREETNGPVKILEEYLSRSV